MKKSSISKFLLSFSIISIITTGCGKKTVKNEDMFYKVKLESLKVNGQEQPINSQIKKDASKGELEYEISGIYTDCLGKSNKKGWKLYNDSKYSDLVVKENDKNCKLSVTGIRIGSGLYSPSDNTSFNQYNFIGKASTNVFGDKKLSLLRFQNTEFSKNNDFIYLTASMTNSDFSKAPSITAEISRAYFGENIDIITTNSRAFKASEPILDHITLSPDYSLNMDGLSAEYDKNKKPRFEGSITLSALPGGQKATHYFIFAGHELKENENHLSTLESFLKNKPNRVKLLEPNTNSIITISKEELEEASHFFNILAKTGEQYNTFHFILVNTENNLNSFDVHSILLK